MTAVSVLAGTEILVIQIRSIKPIRMDDVMEFITIFILFTVIKGTVHCYEAVQEAYQVTYTIA